MLSSPRSFPPSISACSSAFCFPIAFILRFIRFRPGKTLVGDLTSSTFSACHGVDDVASVGFDLAGRGEIDFLRISV
jgi:hypothetical protein